MGLYKATSNQELEKIAGVTEVKGEYSPNLLVNGDFQCNQRKKDSYGGELVRTFDMWFLARGFVTQASYGEIPKPKNGILMVYNTNFENNQLWQFLDEELDYKKKYTLSYRVDGVDHSFTFKPTATGYQENIHAKFRLYTTLENTRNKRVICIDLFKNKSINIEYIDLFEGDIAYPHVKENSSIAMTRCSQYLKMLRLNWAGYITTSPAQQTFPFEISMKSIPTIVVAKGSTVLSEVSYSVNKERFVWILKNNTAAHVYIYDYLYEITCEPL